MKSKKSIVLLFVAAVLVLSACVPQPVVETDAPEVAVPTETSEVDADALPEAASESLPAVCLEDEFGCAVIDQGETVKIGLGGPLLGDYAMFGLDISDAVSLALAHAGDFEGWTFELVKEDTGASPEVGAAVANKFVTDQTIVAIAGHIFSGETEAAMPIYEKAGLPMMSASATNPPLTQLGSAVFNRLAFLDSAQSEMAADYLFNQFGVTKLAVVHDGSTYGQGLGELTRDAFEDLGGEVVAFEAITPGEADYVAPLSALAAKEPEAVYFGGYAAEAIVMMNQWSQAGLDGVLLFGCDGTFGTEFTEKTGTNGEGAVAVSLVPPDSEQKTVFDAAYAEAFGREPGSLSAFSWAAYDSGWVLVNAIKAVSFVENGALFVPRGALVQAVRTTEYEGITGLVKCDAVGECNASGPAFYQVVDGEWLPLSFD